LQTSMDWMRVCQPLSNRQQDKPEDFNESAQLRFNPFGHGGSSR
jgi:hypothetical protein